jgi:PAS domain-containing protein
MRFRNISLKWQFITIVALVALPFILLSIYNLQEQKNKELEHAKNSAISIARTIGIQQKTTEVYTRQMLSLLSKLPELQPEQPDSQTLSVLFRDVLSENPQFAMVLSVLPNGRAYAAATPFKPFSVADRKYYKDVMRTHSFAVGDLAKSRLTNKPVIHYALPLLNPQKQVKLILIASFDIEHYQNLLSLSTLPKGSDFAFYDYSGRLLYNSLSPQKFIGKRGIPEIQEAIKAETDEGSFFSTSDGQKRLYGFVRINIEKESPYMYVVVSSPQSSSYSGYQILFSRNFILICLALLLSILISIYYRTYIFKNIDKLVNFANALREGNLSKRSNIDYSSGETGSLAFSLDKLAESLAKKEIERDNAISDLKTLTERFEIAVNSAHIGIWEWDLLTHRVYWDTQMFNLYNTIPFNFQGTMPEWLKFMDTEDAARFEEELHHAIRHKKNHKTTFRIKTTKGVKNIRSYFNVITDAAGKSIRLTGVNWDISERVLIENELTRSKELLEENITTLKAEIKTTLMKLKEKIEETFNRNEGTNIKDEKELKSIMEEVAHCGSEISAELDNLSQKL